ncbi:hypothetical protein [Shewanella subflava]|uniref:Uncharacterized protein n=1 Tax=Shewanella subflava TaxID=2986476 RepID=A0ABT3I660_9GAMM|nr:hypothetical protein [Shewanella subflava]MCW3171440.1 hypothetical protein [Shewanella subflava]
MNTKKPILAKSPNEKVYRLNGNGEFSLNLNDKKIRQKVMNKINRFKDFPVTA